MVNYAAQNFAALAAGVSIIAFNARGGLTIGARHPIGHGGTGQLGSMLIAAVVY